MTYGGDFQAYRGNEAIPELTEGAPTKNESI